MRVEKQSKLLPVTSSLNPTNLNESSNLACPIPFTYFHKGGQNSPPKIIIRIFVPEWIIKFIMSDPYFTYFDKRGQNYFIHAGYQEYHSEINLRDVARSENLRWGLKSG